jgi:hypothetical protein
MIAEARIHWNGQSEEQPASFVRFHFISHIDIRLFSRLLFCRKAFYLRVDLGVTVRVHRGDYMTTHASGSAFLAPALVSVWISFGRGDDCGLPFPAGLPPFLSPAIQAKTPPFVSLLLLPDLRSFGGPRVRLTITGAPPGASRPLGGRSGGPPAQPGGGGGGPGPPRI